MNFIFNKLAWNNSCDYFVFFFLLKLDFQTDIRYYLQITIYPISLFIESQMFHFTILDNALLNQNIAQAKFPHWELSYVIEHTRDIIQRSAA